MYNFKVRCLQVEVTMCICENQSLDRTLNDRAIRIFRSILLMNGSVGEFLWNLFWVYVIVSGENKEPTQHTIHAGYGWMLLISNIPAAIPAQYRLWGKFRDDDSWSVWQSWRSDTSEEIDGFGLFQVLKGSWRAARTPHNHISDTRSSMQSYLCGCYKINWDWWIGVWMSNSRYTIFHRDQNKVV